MKLLTVAALVGGGSDDDDGSGTSTAMPVTREQRVDDASSAEVQDWRGVPRGGERRRSGRTRRGYGRAVADRVWEKVQTLSIQSKGHEWVHAANGKRERNAGGDGEGRCPERRGKRVRSVDDVFGELLSEWRTVTCEEEEVDADVETLASGECDALFASCLAE